jgi:RNA recognition motif-containing protein
MATMSIYVGNLSFDTTESELETLFARYGSIDRINIVRNHETESTYGYIEMDAEGAQQAIEELDGMEFAGRILLLNRARKEDRFSRRQTSG